MGPPVPVPTRTEYLDHPDPDAGESSASDPDKLPAAPYPGPDNLPASPSRNTLCAEEVDGSWTLACSQGLTLVHFSAQLEPFLAQNTTYTSPSDPLHTSSTS